MYIGNSLRYEKDMEARRNYNAYLAEKRQKNFVLGPYLASSIFGGAVSLYIPMVMFHTEIWNFWRGKKFRWSKRTELFRMTVPESADCEKWLERARVLYYQMWNNVNEGKEWDENSST